MERRTVNQMALSGYQIQAARRNKLEYHRLERQVASMHDDLQQRLVRLQREARYLRSHYANVVRVVKPPRRYQVWQETHAYEIKQAERQEWQGEFRRRSKRKTGQSGVPSNSSTRPWFLLYNDNITVPMIQLHRPTTSSIDRHLVEPLPMLHEHLTQFRNHSHPQSSRPETRPCLPLIVLKRNMIDLH